MPKLMKYALTPVLTLFAVSAMASSSIIGIGTALSQDKGQFIVNEVFLGSPAARAGLHPKDIIMAVDGQEIKGKSLKQVVKSIRGVEGSKISLTLADGQGHLREARMIREKFEIMDECLLEGSIFLNTNATSPTATPTLVSGYVGNQTIFWNISKPFVYAHAGTEYFNLSYSSVGAISYIQGFLHGTYINWMGQNGHFYGYQPCIK